MHVADRKLDGQRGGLRLGLVAVCAVIALAGCTNNKNRVLFDGEYFRTKAKSASDDRRSFVVRVPRADRSPDGARAAGAYEGARYCMESFGTSEIDWVQGPGGDDGTPVIEGNTLTLTGRCVLW
jgi:hypothetical protein